MSNRIVLRENILALDIATHTGYFSIHGSGSWNFTEGKKRNNNKLHKHFRDTIIDYVRTYGITQIVAEDVNVNNYFSDIRRLSELRGILLEVCDELNLPEPYFVNVTALKKWATGNSKATKGDMIKACETHYGLQTEDNNEADACHLYYYFIRKFRIH